jgi:hypothetical protein
MNQDELLDALEDSREAFLDVIDAIPQELWEKPGVMQDWSIKDILYHLTMWEAELVKLLWQITQGLPPKTALTSEISDDERNAQWQAQSQTRTLDQVLEDFQGVRRQTTRRLMEIPEKMLQNPKQFDWSNDTPLWKWVAASSFEHESEHAQAIRAWRYDEQTE